MWIGRNSTGEICDSKVICDTANNPKTRTPENRANAHLIAAAPEMLDTLEHIADVLNHMAPCPEEVLDRLLACAQSVIRKARGGQ